MNRASLFLRVAEIIRFICMSVEYYTTAYKDVTQRSSSSIRQAAISCDAGVNKSMTPTSLFGNRSNGEYSDKVNVFYETQSFKTLNGHGCWPSPCCWCKRNYL